MLNTPKRIAFCALVFSLACVGAHADVAVGDSFPSLDSLGSPAALPATAGKVLIVDFWASWCAPCKASFPAYSRIQSEYSPKGLVLIAVSVDDNPRDYASFLKRFSPTFPVFLDQGHRLVQQVAVPTMPTCYLVDRHGRVRFIHAGYHGAATDTELRHELDLLLTEP